MYCWVMSKYKSELLILPSIQYLALNGIMIDNVTVKNKGYVILKGYIFLLICIT